MVWLAMVAKLSVFVADVVKVKCLVFCLFVVVRFDKFFVI